MFDWLKNWRKSPEEKLQEAITAYLDGALPARETAAFEARLRDDAALRADVEAQRAVKLMLRQAPRLKAPRNFVLDPAAYSKPRPVPLSIRLYPQLRTATLVATFLFMAALTLNLFTPPGGLSSQQDVAMAPVPPVAQTIEPLTEVEATTLNQADAAPAAAEMMVVESEVVEEMEEEEEMAEEEVVADQEMAEADIAVQSESAPAPTSTPAPTATLAAAGAPAVMGGEAAASDELEDGSDDVDAAADLVAPRATATPDSSRLAIETRATTAEEEAANPVESGPDADLAAADQPESGDAASAAVAEAPSVEVETPMTERPLNANPPTSIWGWSAIFLGILSLFLLGLTLWSRRQMRP